MIQMVLQKFYQSFKKRNNLAHVIYLTLNLKGSLRNKYVGHSRLFSHTYGHLIFDKEAKTIQWRKKSIFNKWCWSNWQSSCRRMQIDPYLLTKLECKQNKDFNTKANTLNLIKEKVGNSLEHIGKGENFLNRTPMAQGLRSTIDKQDHLKLESFFKEKVTRIKQQPIDFEKILKW